MSGNAFVCSRPEENVYDTHDVDTSLRGMRLPPETFGWPLAVVALPPIEDLDAYDSPTTPGHASLQSSGRRLARWAQGASLAAFAVASLLVTTRAAVGSTARPAREIIVHSHVPARDAFAAPIVDLGAALAALEARDVARGRASKPRRSARR